MAAKKRRAAKPARKGQRGSIYFHCNLTGDDNVSLRARTEAMRPKRALQAMKDIVSEMRTTMGYAKTSAPIPEPQWLTDAVNAQMARLRHNAIVSDASIGIQRIVDE